MAADDYLSDREQEEALRNWWRENWRWLMGGVALGLAILGGWNYWKTHRVQQAAAAGQVYEQFQAAVGKPDVEQAGRLLSDLVGEHGDSAYTQQARLLLAKTHVDAGRYDDAIGLLNAVAEDSQDEELASVARLRVARLHIQKGDHDAALKLLDPEKAGAFAAQVREVRGDALYAKGDTDGARAEYAAALAANADAQIDRTTLELKLQQVGGGETVAAATPAAGAEAN
jgi:predicted negative regulator of RcsB-dependent stress response